MGALRHPYEGSRFAIALVASALSVAFGVLVLVMIGQQSEIALIVLLVVASLAAAWVLIQLWRIRLLADAVLVGPQTLPEVQAAVDTVRERLDFHGRLPVFVVDRIGRVMTGEAAAVTLTSFFGVNVLVAEGGALGDLSDEGDHERLVFVLATYFGAVKARTAQWTPFLYALQFTFLPKLVFPFVYPWMRATVYTGDRIAYACCGDLNIGLEACYRALVGKEVAGHIQASGLTGQALTVRSRFLLRLTQLLRPVPHVTNRYLDLLSFAAVYEPAAYERFRGSLDPSVAAVDGVLHRLQKRRPSPVAIPVGVALSALLLIGGVVVAQVLRAPDSPGQTSPSNGPTPAPDSSGNGVVTPSPEPVPVSNIAELTVVVAPPATPIGQDAAGNPVNYGAANLTDGDASSAWRMRGDGTGQVITFTFNQPRHAHSRRARQRVREDGRLRRHGQVRAGAADHRRVLVVRR